MRKPQNEFARRKHRVSSTLSSTIVSGMYGVPGRGGSRVPGLFGESLWTWK